MKQLLKKLAVGVASTTTVLGFGLAPAVGAAPNVGVFNTQNDWVQNYGVGMNVINSAEATSMPAAPTQQVTTQTHTVQTEDWSHSTWTHHHQNHTNNWWHHEDESLVDVDADVELLDNGDLLDADVDASVGSYHYQHHSGGLLDLDLDLDLL